MTGIIIIALDLAAKKLSEIMGYTDKRTVNPVSF